MEITINEAEIKEGCKAYVASQGINLEGQSVEIKLTAGRGVNGFSAAVVIGVDGTKKAVKDTKNDIADELKEEEEENTINQDDGDDADRLFGD